jgi:hypothetical protein
MGLTVKGVPINSVQTANATTGLGVANQLQAGAVASIALIYAAMGESSLGDDTDTYSGVSVGVWQAQPPHYNGGHDTAGEA